MATMNDNRVLWETLNGFRKKDPTGFNKLVGYLFPNGLEVAFDALEDDPLTPDEIRAAYVTTESQRVKLAAFYACCQARMLLLIQEKENRIAFKNGERDEIHREEESQISEEDDDIDEQFELFNG